MTDSIEDAVPEYHLDEEGDQARRNERGTPEEPHHEKGNFGEDLRVGARSLVVNSTMSNPGGASSNPSFLIL